MFSILDANYNKNMMFCRRHYLQLATRYNSSVSTSNRFTSTINTPDNNPSTTVEFGPNIIKKEFQIFYETSKSYGLCNTSPILPGHVLVCPKLKIQHLEDLPSEDLQDLMLAVQTVSTALKKHYNADALTINCQDGVAAGQTVPHIHFHILPRKFGDFKDKGEVYKKLRVHDKVEKHELKRRTLEEMESEAIEFRKLFE